MASTYSTNLKIELMGTGENSGTWGTITNTNLGTAFEQAVIGLGNPDYTSDANLTITLTNSNAAQAARALVLNVTSAFGSLTATRELIVPTTQKQYIVQNNTTGGQSITVKTSAGTGITVPTGRKAHLYVDGTNVIQMFDFVDINGGTIDGATVGAASASTGAFTSLTASGATTLNGAVALGDASGDLITVPGTVNSNLLFTDATYDIGATGATRPRDLFLSRNLTVGGTLTLAGGVNLNGNVTVGDSSADTLTINSTITSNLIFTDNTYDIGASGATRPRSLFLAGNITAAGNQTLAGALTVDSTTDSTSTTTGSIQTDGGVGIAKALFVGTTANIAGVATFSAGTAALPALTTTGDTNTGIFFPAADSVATTVGGSEGTRLTSTGFGIGSTSPATKLDVNGDITQRNGSGTIIGTVSNNGGWYQLAGSTNVNGVQLWSGSATTAIRFGGGTTFTEQARFDTSGNFGIGNSSPATKLDVNGGVQVTGSVSGYGGGEVRLGPTTSAVASAISTQATGAPTLDFAHRGTSNTGTFNFLNGTGAANLLMTLTSTGLGIGTSSPSGKLSVTTSTMTNQIIADSISDSTTYGLVSLNGNRVSNAYLGIAGGGGTDKTLFYNVPSTGKHSFRNAFSEQMVLDASGNLGLGVTPSAWASPLRPLQIVNASLAGHSSDGTALYLSANTFYDGSFKYISTAIASQYRQQAGVHSWHTAASGTAGNAITFTQAMTLDASGNLGVGTTSFSSKLNLRGASSSNPNTNGIVFQYSTTGTNLGAIGLDNASGDLAILASTGGAIRFNTNSDLATTNERARITSAGLVGIGTTAPAAKLSVVDTNGGFFFDGTDATYNRIKSHTTSTSVGKPFLITAADPGDLGIYLTTSSNVGIGTNTPATSGGTALVVHDTSTPRIRLTSTTTGQASTDGAELSLSGSDFYIENREAQNIVFYSGSERARITSAGSFIVGATAEPDGTSGGAGFMNASLGRKALVLAVTSTANANLAEFKNPNGTVGSIATNGSATAYNTSSDYRLKNTIAPMTGALAKVGLLKPCTYKWNADGSDGQGFIAHELAEVCPQAVNGEKDAVNADGKPIHQGIDTSFLVATLTAAIQEQQAIIESLKARLDAANL